MQMSLRRLSILVAAAGIIPGCLLSGCSAHQAQPATPVDSAKTPTFRSSTNSYDQPNTPLYTQPGVNHGTAVKLPAIGKVDRFDQNAPLAEEVYGQLQAQLGRSATNYITAESKGDTVQLGGTAADAATVAKASAIAKTAKGVGSVINKITVAPK